MVGSVPGDFLVLLAWMPAVCFHIDRREACERTCSMKVSDPQSMPAEHWRPGVETRMVVSVANGATHLCIFEQSVAIGTGAPTHSHPVEEVLTVREGEAEMWIGEERVILTSGQSLIVPAGRLHGFRNCGAGVLHLHAVLASPVFEAMMEGAAETTRRWDVVPPSTPAVAK
jgi:mannose-6-phosphate isomerase-like protein (cupin superfamily)